MLDVHWTITVHVPQLDTLQQTIMTIGERVVASVDSIKQELTRLTEAQAAGSQAIADQITVIADEIAQFSAGAITQEQLERLEAELRTAADTATQQATATRANTQAIAGIVPDAPPTP